MRFLHNIKNIYAVQLHHLADILPILGKQHSERVQSRRNGVGLVTNLTNKLSQGFLQIKLSWIFIY